MGGVRPNMGGGGETKHGGGELCTGWHFGLFHTEPL